MSPRRWRRLGLPAAAACLLAVGGLLGISGDGAGRSRTVASPRVAPDEDATGLFDGLAPGAPLAEGWTLIDAFVDRGAIVARVGQPGRPGQPIVFGSPRVRHAGARAAHAAFVVQAAPSLQPAAAPLVAALARTAEARGSDALGADALFEHAAVPGDVAPGWIWWIAIATACCAVWLAAAAVLSGWPAARRMGQIRRIGLALTIVVLAWGGMGALAHSGQTRGPLHANAHGGEELDDLVYPLLSPYPAYVGATQAALTDLGFAAGQRAGLQRSVAGLWRMHAALGGAGALAAALLALELLLWTVGRVRPAVAAAVIVLGGLGAAWHPHLLRVYGSESAFAWEVALLPAMWWGLLRYARRGELRAYILAAGAGALATGLHALTPVHALWPALLAPVALGGCLGPGRVGPRPGGRGAREPRRGLALLLLSGALLLWTLPHLQLLVALGDARGPAALLELRMRAVYGLLSPLNLPFVPATGVWPLAWGGLAAVFLAVLPRRPTLAFALLLATGVLLLKGLLLQTCWTDVVRYQVPTAAWLAVLGSFGAGLLVHLAGPGPLRAATVLLVGGVLWWSAQSAAPAFHTLDDEARAYAWWQNVAGDPGLPAHATILTVGAPKAPPGVAGEAPRAPFFDAGRAVRLRTFQTERGAVATRRGHDMTRGSVVVARDLSLAWLAAAARDSGRRRRRAALHASEHLRALHKAWPGPWRSLGATSMQPASSPVATVAPAYHTLGGEPARLELLVPAEPGGLSAGPGP